MQSCMNPVCIWRESQCAQKREGTGRLVCVFRMFLLPRLIQESEETMVELQGRMTGSKFFLGPTKV